MNWITAPFGSNSFTNLVPIPSNKINPGYPLDTISINKKLNKYFTDITKEDKLMLQEDESDVIEFIVSSVKD